MGAKFQKPLAKVEKLYIRSPFVTLSLQKYHSVNVNEGVESCCAFKHFTGLKQVICMIPRPNEEMRKGLQIQMEDILGYHKSEFKSGAIPDVLVEEMPLNLGLLFDIE